MPLCSNWIFTVTGAPSCRRREVMVAATLLMCTVYLLTAMFSFISTFAVPVELESVSRVWFPLDGDVAWVMQVSDLHLSAFHADRADELARLLPPALRAIRPSLLLFTGDLTDAKSKRRTSSRQDEVEWVQYKNTVDVVLRNSGFDKRRVFDIRGNHDKYGVPYAGSKLDFFSAYSVSSQLNRLSTTQSIALVGNVWTYVFVGIDDTMSVGIRGPSNLFGHPTDQRMKAVESELLYWENHANPSVTKVVFGHFPLSFTASTATGQHYENLFARQSVSAYICGHLHTTFGRQLWRLHTVKKVFTLNDSRAVNQFWEWEVGDWKDSRLIRILAIDGGHVSFLDFQLPNKQKQEDDFPTTILVTYPLDSRSMNYIGARSNSRKNDINVLVFSVQAILNVTAKVFDSLRSFKIEEEIPLCLHTASKPLFHAKWNAENYRSKSATRYWLQVFVLDSLGQEIKSTIRPFSVDGGVSPNSSPWLALFAFGMQLEDVYVVLLCSNVAFIILLLFLPKVLSYFMSNNASYQMGSVLFSAASPIWPAKLSSWVIWYLIEGSRSVKFWFFMVIYFLYLLSMPWFWGYATSENGDIGTMYLFGWSLRNSKNTNTRNNVASPDIMTITLPFMYIGITPMFLLIYSLFAERAAACLNTRKKGPDLDMDNRHRLYGESRPNSSGGIVKVRTSVQKMYGGRIRKLLLLGCLILFLLHSTLCGFLMAAYGTGIVAISPALTWAPPLFMVSAVYFTAPV